MLRKSESTKMIAAALIEFHKVTPQIVKDSVNPHFGNRFASRGAIIRAVDPYLHSVGLVLAQFPSTTPDGSPGLDSLLMHVSGEWIATESPLMLAKSDPQGQGSALTYMERYADTAILRIVADEDDDAEKATRSAPIKAFEQRASTIAATYEEVNGEQIPLDVPMETTRSGPASDLASPKQLKWATDLLNQAGIGEGSAAEEWFRINELGTWPGSLRNMTKGQASKVIGLLK